MDYRPTGEERDWRGVCRKCGKMGGTKIIDLLDTTEKQLERMRELGISLGIDDEEGSPANMHDYREVTRCCDSEDFIPDEYVERCPKCGKYYDERRGKCNCS